MNGGMSQFNEKELHIITFRQNCILNILSNIIMNGGMSQFNNFITISLSYRFHLLICSVLD